MQPVNLGIIGLGHMGRRHAEMLLAGRVPGVKLSAAVTSRPDWLRERAPSVRICADHRALLNDSDTDAVLICTPHRWHVPQAVDALRAGRHVLIEKPVAADWRETAGLCRARDEAQRQVGVMFHLRMHPVYRRIRELLRSRALGRIRRVSWTMTAWSRDQAYYDQAAWRGTWEGEGGGVLLNQCAHHLDLLCWFFGMPLRMQAACAFGKYHRIEVEDEAVLLLEYADGATGVFTASTGEPQGENRLQVIGSEGELLLADAEKLCVRSNGGDWVAQEQVCQAEPSEELHAGVIRRFAEAVRGGGPVEVSVEEAARSVRLANAAVECARTGTRADFSRDEDFDGVGV